MSCCGQQRAALRSAAQRAAAVAASSVLQAPVRLAYQGGGPTVARGRATGRTYLFGPRDTALDVDARDADALLASGRFVVTPT